MVGGQVMQNDWRLVNQKNYLNNKKLKRALFKYSGECDHRHCAFCWDKFSEDPADLHIGYCTIDNYWWICDQCFSDFSDEFLWEIIDI